MKKQELTNQWDDVLFRTRNKCYGAYQLRRKLSQHTLRAFVWASLGLSAVIAIPTVASAFKDDTLSHESTITEIVLSPTEYPSQPNPIPQVETLRPEPAGSTSPSVEFIEPDVVDAAVAPDASQIINPDTVSQQVALGPNLAAGDPNADPNEVLDISQIDNRTGNPGSATEVGDAVPQEEHTVLTVNEAPVPVNLDEFMRAIQYPEPARNAGITGTVTVRVLVDDNGRYAKHKVLRSPHPWLTQEVERHLPSIRFTPAIANNRAVVCWLTVPIKFQL